MSTEPSDPSSFTPRPTCERCERPLALCWCAHLVSLPTRTRVVLLQHPRERGVAIGTAKMAHLCLPNSELHVGVDWGDSQALARALSDPERPAALLYPGEGAIDLEANPPEHPVTLVVVDGTWAHTRKVVRVNPVLAALPRYAFRPPAPSEYRIRREPTAEFVSTIEALAHALGLLERDPATFEALRVPFRAMIDAQIACEQREQNHRGRKPRGPRPPKPTLEEHLRARRDDLVCVIAEANAWPRRPEEGGRAFDEELLQWVAYRPSTGECFDAIVVPHHPLGPGTESQTGLTAEMLAGGEPADVVLARWRDFVRPTDVICSWGEFGTQTFLAAGGVLPDERVDLRRHARRQVGGRAGTPAEHYARLGGDPASVVPHGRGRAGVRLGMIAAVARKLAE